MDPRVAIIIIIIHLVTRLELVTSSVPTPTQTLSSILKPPTHPSPSAGALRQLRRSRQLRSDQRIGRRPARLDLRRSAPRARRHSWGGVGQECSIAWPDGDRDDIASRARVVEEHEDHCYASHTRCLSFVRASLCAVIALRVRTRTSPRLPPFGWLALRALSTLPSLARGCSLSGVTRS